MKDFSGKIAMIIGGTSGIGLACAEQLLESGAIVFVCSRNEVKVNKAVNHLKKMGNVHGIVGDFSDESTVIESFKSVGKSEKKIDILINAAGVSAPGKISDISVKDFQNIVDCNLTYTFLTCKEGFKYMKTNGGKIVNVSSIAGRFRSQFSGVHYSSSKGAVLTLTKQLGAEFAPYGINVNAICPGPTKTEMLRPHIEEVGEKEIESSLPMGKLPTAKDQANAIIFLCSSKADFITGSWLDVNGGQF